MQFLFYIYKKKKGNRENEGMDALTVDRAVPVRSTQINKKEVELEIRPADTIEDYARRKRREGQKREQDDERDRRRQLREAH
jgi:hypothetical protein